MLCNSAYISVLFLFTIAYTTRAQKVIPLYADKIPNQIVGPDEEFEKNEDVFIYGKVSKPTLTIFLPPKEIATGAAVVICPGGGYGVLAFKHEGIAVAEAFNKIGVAAFVLKYRLPDEKIMVNKTIGPLQDAQQAIKLVRQNAKEWGVHPKRIGIAGFSAGGHLASTAGTHFNNVVIDNAGVSVRPDFMILIYPVISMQDSLTHEWSRENLLGKSPSTELKKSYSNELQITPQTPPAFIIHAGNDDAVKVANSIRFYEALNIQNIHSELIIYPKGGHGFGMNNNTTSDQWFDRCQEWMQSNGWLKSLAIQEKK